MTNKDRFLSMVRGLYARNCPEAAKLAKQDHRFVEIIRKIWKEKNSAKIGLIGLKELNDIHQIVYNKEI